MDTCIFTVRRRRGGGGRINNVIFSVCGSDVKITLAGDFKRIHCNFMGRICGLFLFVYAGLK